MSKPGHRSTTHLEGHTFIRAPRAAVYRLMTDFDHLPAHFPKVAQSIRILSRDGDRFVAEARTRAFPGSGIFIVRMEGQLRPPFGFVSTNTSSLGVEHETFLMDEEPGGTRIHYINDVEIRSPFFRLFGAVLIKRLALWYWEQALIRPLAAALER